MRDKRGEGNYAFIFGGAVNKRDRLNDFEAFVVRWAWVLFVPAGWFDWLSDRARPAWHRGAYRVSFGLLGADITEEVIREMVANLIGDLAASPQKLAETLTLNYPRGWVSSDELERLEAACGVWAAHQA